MSWNGELIWKMRSELGFQWDMFEEEIPTIFEGLLQRLEERLKEVESYLDSQLWSMS